MNTLFPKHEDVYLEYKEVVASLSPPFFETVCAFFNQNGDHIVLCIADDGVVMDVKPGSAQPFEELNDSFSATVSVPGKGVAPEVTPEVVSRLHRYRLTRLGRAIAEKDRKS